MKTAFEKYLIRKHGNNPEAIAKEIESIVIANPGGTNVAWKLLKQTGHSSYTRETFLKVARSIIDEPAKS